MGGALAHCGLLLFLLSHVAGLEKHQCTDTFGSTIPLQITPGHRIVLTTPNYPNVFKNKWLNCVWKIEGLYGTRVQVNLVHMALNEACNDNILTVQDNTPKGSGSPLQSPGLAARCGQSDFPPSDLIGNHTTSDGVVTVRFKSQRNNGNSLFKLVVTGLVPSACPAKLSTGCPDGPCCTGDNCCKINVGDAPEEIMSPNFPAPSKRGLDCQYTLVTAPGSQIALNFLNLDIRTDSNQACLSDYIVLEDPNKSPASLIGSKKTLCGQTLPNYPAPSILVSAGNSLTVKYHTDKSTSIKGSGFKATVSALNPTCNKMQFQYQYGEEVCNSTCGNPYTPYDHEKRKLTTTTTTTPKPHLKNETCEKPDTVYDNEYNLQVIEDCPKWEDCATHCWENKDACTHFSWTQDKTCTLKTSDEGEQEEPGTVSGTADCGEGATYPTPVTTTPGTPSPTTIPELTNKTCEEEGYFYDSVLTQKQIKNIKSWEECAYLCRLDPECKGWSWASSEFVEATVIHTCALKPKLVIGTQEGGPASKKKGAVRGTKDCGNYVSTTTPSNLITTTPGILKNETCQINDTHHKGTPLQSVDDITLWEECAHICRNTDGCLFWSYFTDSFSVGTFVGRCDMQGSDEGFKELPGVVSGNAECGEWETTTPQPTTIPPIQNKTCGNPDENILGVPIKIIHGIDTWQHCAYLCNQDNKCQAWTWYSEKYPLDSYSGDCDLKEKDEGKAKTIGIISGTSDCGSPPTSPTPFVSSTTTPNPETETIPPEENEVCSNVIMIIKVLDKSTRDPVPRANVM